MRNYCQEILTLTFIISLLFVSISNGQNLLDGPESVAFDSLNNRYLVSSLRNNKIISIDTDGNQTLFKESIVSFGNCIKDSTLYVTGNATIRGLNISTAADVFSVTVPGVLQFDGITADDSGYIYALATRIGVVYKIHIETQNYWAFVDSGFGAAPQDLIFDKFKNRILACQWHPDASVLAINLEDSVLSVAAEKTAGYSDGITLDQEGNVYITSYMREGEVYKFDNDFNGPPELIYVGVEEPAGLDYNIVDDILAVPSFSGDRVEFIKMPPTYLFPKIGANYKTGQVPLTLNFTDRSSSNPKISQWEWDFENDGNIDSYEQNPEWTFSEPGIYKVKANFISDSLSKSIILEDSIVVFDGESSLNFSNSNSVLKIPPTEELNLKDEWTFEAWVNPTNLHGKYILDKNSVSIYTNRRSSGLKNNSLVVKFVREDESTIRFTTEDSSLTLNEWQHIALAYEYSNKKIEIYIDGILQQLSVDNNSIFTSPIENNEIDTLLLGNNRSGLRALKGNMDEVRIWKSSLSKEEIDANRYKYLVGDEEGLVAYWNINEGNGESIIDLSSNGNDGKVILAEYDWGIDYDALVSVENRILKITLPNDFELFQNYPNPFNPSTIIKYTIPIAMGANFTSSTNVLLKVYDVLGCEVATLVNEIQKPGEYKVEFDASLLSSGVYLYKIITDQNFETKKMILVR